MQTTKNVLPLRPTKITLNSPLNPFLANFPILYSLKTPENLWFSGVFRGYKMGTLARNESILCFGNEAT